MAWKKDENGVYSIKFDASEFKLTNLEILEILKYAKDCYVKLTPYDHKGMCICVYFALLYKYGMDFSYPDIDNLIPEFNPDFLDGKINAQNYWWNIFDKESRIAAFDTLINTYDKKQWITYKY